MLKKRLISSAAWLLFLWLVIFIFPVWAFGAAVVAVTGMGLFEFYQMASRRGILVSKFFGTLIGCLIPVSVYLQFSPSAEIEFMLIAATCLAVFLLQFARHKTEDALTGVSTTIFGIFYISWFFSFLLKLRLFPPTGMDGRFVVLYLLIVTKAGDAAAYFIGTAFGKHHLIPHISPKKSIEGTIAGFLVTFLAAILLRGFLPSLHLVHICIIGFMLGIISQVGDLSESLIKRDCKVKDSSSIFPGLGGVLDLIDSLLFAIPVFYFYLRLIP